MINKLEFSQIFHTEMKYILVELIFFNKKVSYIHPTEFLKF